ncbi:MAG: 3-oxo-tetronate kinase [Casimicrobiaceae bacterium]
MLLGCIGDDFTGSTDLANMLVRGGMRTLQTIGVPAASLTEDIDACVVALKSRTSPAAEAVAESLAALQWLRAQGCRQFYFKYCSTFDSTPAGNIGPVTDALMDALADLPNSDFTIACPAFPENGRTIFRGYLYVGDVLLSESGMQDHPLTPMTDANLVRVLQPQTRRKVGLIRFDTVLAGAAAIRERIAALRREGIAIAVVDAVTNDDLSRIAEACADLPLVTAGSGIGLGLANHYAKTGKLGGTADAAFVPAVAGLEAVVSGSCSVATNGQVAEWLKTRPGFRIDPLRVAAGDDIVVEATAWAQSRLRDGPILIYATSDPAAVREVQSQLGVERAGALTEATLAGIAQQLVRQGVRRLVVAGGETSGAVVKALGVTTMRIGRQIDPGVPWTEAHADVGAGATCVALALKSGNFGTVDFFEKALAMVRRN